jgi:hypothetical protein
MNKHLGAKVSKFRFLGELTNFLFKLWNGVPERNFDLFVRGGGVEEGFEL